VSNLRPEKKEELKFDVKEIGYILKCLEDGHHSGSILELALSCKLKIQKVLQKLINNKEAI
jgi:hypothetical protein